ncbi:Cytochrome C oxidase, cbb3-type, subunit III [Paracoccus halophilus]|uniref:Cytochrome C oxidase, cbb3-type, subunit III n=1 Tax=Paracoccus halophilus TaxID=376733 RepID=A0A099F4R0_9RHOB|nr:nitrite reductase [Paracoccus halophilus]KGJ05404.1 cytochrome Cbb3 [Paracoccus halophilus]SFA49061.1 Cytochrome C oxidase, cbb3-type, subunit III [Paracoccus halophilus]
MIRRIVSCSLLALLPMAAMADPAADYADYCASCHGEDRLGGTGPALIPETLGRVRDVDRIIAEGRVSTQMAGFAGDLSPERIAALVGYLKTPLATLPDWGADQITASRSMNPDYRPADAPVFSGDPMNITLVVETGDHHVSVLDGDTFQVLDRFATPFAVHGGPKFSPDGRFVYIMSRDGWVQKYDIWSLSEVGRTRAALNSRNIAISPDGKWLAVANYLPASLTILDSRDLSPVKMIEVIARDKTPSRVSAVYQAPARDSFILALKDAPEIWEIATDPEAGPFYDGFVHNYQSGAEEALGAEKGLFARRRIVIDEPVDDFFFSPDYRELIGANRNGDKGVVVNLDVGRIIAELPLPGLPHLGSGITWERDGRRVMATPHLGEGVLSVIDMQDWSLVGQIETPGPGFFLRSHANSPYLWADVFFGPNKDQMLVIDKQSLQIVKALKPFPGQTFAHAEFTRDGSHVLVSLWEDEGAVVVYDAKTLQEVKRLPMRKPSGKYNVWNKITFEDGTSH